MAGVEVDVSGPALSTDLIARTLEALDHNDMALNGRLVSKGVCSYLNQAHYRTAHFKMPLPRSAHGAAWQPLMQHAYEQLPFRRKVGTLMAAATSGSEANLELAWGLVHQSLSLAGLHCLVSTTTDDPGTAAVRSGHLHLLPWLQQHGCIKHQDDMFALVLERCSLPEVQRVWEQLGWGRVPCILFPSYLKRLWATAAGRSADPDAAKLSWLLSVMADPATPQHVHAGMLQGAAVGATASGNLPVLRWLCAQGLDVLLGSEEAVLPIPGHATRGVRVLSSALQHEHLAVADWLVDEMGLSLPLGQEQEQQWEQEFMWKAAVAGASGEAVRWLLCRGVPLHTAAVEAAAKAGRFETVRLLHSEHGMPLTERVFAAAAESGSVPLATWLLQAGCAMSSGAYIDAASAGDAAMLRWLAQEASCPWDRNTLAWVIGSWPSGASGMDSLEAAVRELLAAGCPPGGGTDDADSVGRAAQVGHLALARYLHEELGVPFAPGTLALAACGGSAPAIEWLVGVGCVPGADTHMQPYTEAGAVGDVDTMACLRRLGVPWGEGVLMRAVRRMAPLPTIRWLVEQGVPWDEAVVRNAVERAKAAGVFKDTVMWLEGRTEPGMAHGVASAGPE